MAKRLLCNIIDIDIDGKKDVLGFWLSKEESSHHWLQILEDVKQRGVEDILFTSLDGLKGLEKAIKDVFPNSTTEKSILCVIRRAILHEKDGLNSLKI